MHRNIYMYDEYPNVNTYVTMLNGQKEVYRQCDR